MALKTEVLVKSVLGRSGQMFANFPTSRATENRSFSSLWSDTAEALCLPRNASTALKYVDLPLAPSPIRRTAF